MSEQTTEEDDGQDKQRAVSNQSPKHNGRTNKNEATRQVDKAHKFYGKAKTQQPCPQRRSRPPGQSHSRPRRASGSLQCTTRRMCQTRQSWRLQRQRRQYHQRPKQDLPSQKPEGMATEARACSATRSA